MPALSPTMEAGTIASWKLNEGESFAAGDSLAIIETDKATIDFEAQDDGVVAKILIEAQSGEIPVGVPIVVTVEDEGDVAAFKNFVPPQEEDTAAPVVAEEAKEDVAAVQKVDPVTPPPTPTLAVEKTSPSAPLPTTTAETDAATKIDIPISPSWGNLASIKSPLASTLAKNQKKYIELYGSTGQVPLGED